MERGLGRREFLRGTAALAAGAAAAGLVGCSQKAEAQKAEGDAGISWDKKADVVVVGSGTGAFAALAGAVYGAGSVIVLEKMGTWGGTTAISGTGMGCPLTDAAKAAGVTDSLDNVLKYYAAATKGRADQKVVEAYVKNGNAFFKWTVEVGLCEKWSLDVPAYQDYYEPAPGFLAYGRGNMHAIRENAYFAGATFWKAIQDKILEKGGEILLETPVQELITDDKGAVVGVLASTKAGNNLYVRANKCVVLATGGFDFNDEMRKKYLPFPLMASVAVKGNTGDGQRMGMALGASVSNMDRSWGLPIILTGQDAVALKNTYGLASGTTVSDWSMYRGKASAIVVNKRGRRIGDETLPYSAFNDAFAAWDTKTAEFANIPAYVIFDSNYTSQFPLPGQKAVGDEVPSFIIQANTLAELAAKLGIDAAGLADEVATFNSYASQGLDPVWGRNTKSVGKFSSGLVGYPRKPLPYDEYLKLQKPTLGPVSKAPFYGVVCVPGTCGTSGGLTTNEKAQVLKVNGDVIPGLYAVGNCSMGVSAGIYVHGGITVGQGSIMGWAAVRDALGVS